MSDVPVLKFKASRGLTIFFVAFSLVFAGVALYIGRTSIANTGKMQTGAIVLVCFFSLATEAMLFGLKILGALEVYNDRIVKYALSGKQVKVILLHDITSWEEKKDYRDRPNQLIIRTATQKLVISPYEKGYDEMKQFLTELR